MCQEKSDFSIDADKDKKAIKHKKRGAILPKKESENQTVPVTVSTTVPGIVLHTPVIGSCV